MWYGHSRPLTCYCYVRSSHANCCFLIRSMKSQIPPQIICAINCLFSVDDFFQLLIEKLSEIAKPEKIFYSLIFFFSSTEIFSKRRKICPLMTEREAECTKSVSIYLLCFINCRRRVVRPLTSVDMLLLRAL